MWKNYVNTQLRTTNLTISIHTLTKKKNQKAKKKQFAQRQIHNRSVWIGVRVDVRAC